MSTSGERYTIELMGMDYDHAATLQAACAIAARVSTNVRGRIVRIYDELGPRVDTVVAKFRNGRKVTM